MKFQKRLFKKNVRGFLISGYRNPRGPVLGIEKAPGLPGWETIALWLGPIRLLIQRPA